VLTGLRLVSIPVTDVDRAKAFYVDDLGFEEVFDGPFGDDMRWVELAPPGSQTSVALVTWFESMTPGSMQGLVLETDDLDEDYEALTAQGIEFLGEISEDPWGSSATFRDPDGNGWVLMQVGAGEDGEGS
jgi:catechol 2,3-dioxygenase-like lactoylglutathione lyase family enzyme